jgi:hypothetical protein
LPDTVMFVVAGINMPVTDEKQCCDFHFDWATGTLRNGYGQAKTGGQKAELA